MAIDKEPKPVPARPIEYISSFKYDCHDQSGCSLFNKLPGEIRDRIYSFALACYDDPNKLYEERTSYRRPSYVAAQRSDIELLLTCQRIYNEAWFRPWTSAVHTVWLTWKGRCPENAPKLDSFQPRLNLLHSLHGDIKLEHFRVFAQLCFLEPGIQLSTILKLKHFHPRCITITIRHHDWWNWESDSPLIVGSRWVNTCRFPDSLSELRLELESLQRKKAQVDDIATQMIRKWQFQCTDGTRLCARECDTQVSSWDGSSTWQDQRWIRDETKPEILGYYVKTVVFKPVKDAVIQPFAQILTPDPVLAAQRIQTDRPSLHVIDLHNAGVLPGTAADEARRLVDEWRARPIISSVIRDELSDELDEPDGILFVPSVEQWIATNFDPPPPAP